MARPKTARPPEIITAGDSTIDREALAEAGHALAAQAMRVTAAEQEFGVDMPYNCDLYIARIKQCANETAQRLIEIGQLLIHIREREAAGTFHNALEQIGFGVRFAQRAMQAAAKLHGMPNLQGLGVSKALELIAEDDDTLAALENGGTLAGLTLDDVDCMSVRELKATLRAERDERDREKQTDEEIIRAKDERINKLTRDKRKGGDEQKLRTAAEDLLRDADEAVVEAASHIARLRKVFGDVEQLYADAGATVDGDIAERLEANARWASDQLQDVADLVGE
jgi:hypothetical protein